MSDFNNFLVETFLRKFGLKGRFYFPTHLTSVSAQPAETTKFKFLPFLLSFYCLIWLIKHQINTFRTENGVSSDSPESEVNVQNFAQCANTSSQMLSAVYDITSVLTMLCCCLLQTSINRCLSYFTLLSIYLVILCWLLASIYLIENWNTNT